MENVLEKFVKQCEEATEFGNDITIKDINRIVITGMGGSGFAGDVVKTATSGSAYVKVVKNYHLPKWIDGKTLVFVVSYSGNTEETLSAFEDALKSKSKIVGIGSGGKLEELCKISNLPFVKVPGGVQPRNAMGYLVISILNILQSNGLIPKQDIQYVVKDLESTKIKTQAETLANAIFGKIPLIYSSQRLACLSYGWKTRMNENSKIHAFAHQIPELNHNELVGYTTKGNFFTIILQDRDDIPQIKKRIEATKQTIEKFGGECRVIDTIGSSLLSRIFCTLYLGDWTSYFVAQKRGIDPEPVQIIEEFKKKL